MRLPLFAEVLWPGCVLPLFLNLQAESALFGDWGSVVHCRSLRSAV